LTIDCAERPISICGCAPRGGKAISAVWRATTGSARIGGSNCSESRRPQSTEGWTSFSLACQGFPPWFSSRRKRRPFSADPGGRSLQLPSCPPTPTLDACLLRRTRRRWVEGRCDQPVLEPRLGQPPTPTQIHRRPLARAAKQVLTTEVFQRNRLSRAGPTVTARSGGLRLAAWWFGPIPKFGIVFRYPREPGDWLQSEGDCSIFPSWLWRVIAVWAC